MKEKKFCWQKYHYTVWPTESAVASLFLTLASWKTKSEDFENKNDEKIAKYGSTICLI